MTKEELFAAIKAKCTAVDLDDAVHQLKAQEAADINNAGIDGQLDYLASNAGLEWLEAFYLGGEWKGRGEQT